MQRIDKDCIKYSGTRSVLHFYIILICSNDVTPILLTLKTKSFTLFYVFPLNYGCAGNCYLCLCYRDCRDEEEADPRVWNNFHEDDILSAAMYPTGLVATSAYDGVVKVWNIDSGHVNCKLTADNYGLETTRSLIPADVKRQVSYGNAGMDINEKNSRLGKQKNFL